MPFHLTGDPSPEQPVEKHCHRCKQIKPASEFRSCRGRNGKPGLSSRCIQCNAEYMKEYYANNKHRWTLDESDRRARNAMRRERYREDPEYRAATIAKVTEYRTKYPDRVRDRKLRDGYGISSDTYNAILSSQGGGCAICGRVRSDEKRISTLHVDHDHATGCVRGILCSKCNKALGLFGDDPDMLIRAARYLQHQESCNASA